MGTLVRGWVELCWGVDGDGCGRGGRRGGGWVCVGEREEGGETQGVCLMWLVLRCV